MKLGDALTKSGGEPTNGSPLFHSSRPNAEHLAEGDREETETFFRFNFTCEGSLSFKRALAVAQTRARLKNTEGSPIQ